TASLCFFFLILRLPPTSTLFPYTTLFRSFTRGPHYLAERRARARRSVRDDRRNRGGRMNLRYAGLMLIASALFVGGCSDRDLRAINPCTVTGVVIKVDPGGSNDVDMLLMIDNSD